MCITCIQRIGKIQGLSKKKKRFPNCLSSWKRHIHLLLQGNLGLLGSMHFRRGQPADPILKEQHGAGSFPKSYGRNPAPFSRASVDTTPPIPKMPSSALHPSLWKVSPVTCTSLSNFYLHSYFESFLNFCLLASSEFTVHAPSFIVCFENFKNKEPIQTYFSSKSYVFLSSLHLWIFSRLHRPVTWEVSNNAWGAGLGEETAYCNNQQDWHLLTLLKAAGLDSHNIKLPTTQRQGTLFFYTRKLFFKGLNAHTVCWWITLSIMRIPLSLLLLWLYFTDSPGWPLAPYPPVAASQMLALQVCATFTMSDGMASLWCPKLSFSAWTFSRQPAHLGSHHSCQDIALPKLITAQRSTPTLVSGANSLSAPCLSLYSEMEMIYLPYTVRLQQKGTKV